MTKALAPMEPFFAEIFKRATRATGSYGGFLAEHLDTKSSAVKCVEFSFFELHHAAVSEMIRPKQDLASGASVNSLAFSKLSMELQCKRRKVSEHDDPPHVRDGIADKVSANFALALLDGDFYERFVAPEIPGLGKPTDAGLKGAAMQEIESARQGTSYSDIAPFLTRTIVNARRYRRGLELIAKDQSESKSALLASILLATLDGKDWPPKFTELIDPSESTQTAYLVLLANDSNLAKIRSLMPPSHALFKQTNKNQFAVWLKAILHPAG